MTDEATDLEVEIWSYEPGSADVQKLAARIRADGERLAELRRRLCLWTRCRYIAQTTVNDIETVARDAATFARLIQAQDVLHPTAAELRESLDRAPDAR